MTNADSAARDTTALAPPALPPAGATEDGAAAANEDLAAPSLEEVARCVATLEALTANRVALAKLPEEARVALRTAAGRLMNPSRDERTRLQKALRRERREENRVHDREVKASTQIRTLRREAIFSAPTHMLPPGAREAAAPRVLREPRDCYVCKAEYRTLHFFYDSMCQECAEFNYAKRFQTAPLEGKVALITGARVKIGYQASLMLLRAGASVIATTRFPQDAAVRYTREPDFAQWAHRLQVHGLDLRHAPSVELFARHVEQTHARLDILINNAAQTVRRPPGWYAHLLGGEQRDASELPAAARPLLAGHAELVGTLRAPHRSLSGGPSAALATSWRSADAGVGIHSSAALSLLPYEVEQEGDLRALYPEGRLDADLQQVDLRETNSWRLRLAEVATAEMLEVHLVNAVAPFILCGKLKPLMLRDRREPGHVVNVSAMEGSFSRGTKTDKHPHTNMAKAALNMMTLTSAPDYARDNIFMNAADTGWVTDEDPAQHAERKVRELDFQPPLDIVDGAARVVDPVFGAVNSGNFVWGNFFKDYKPTSW